MTMINIDPAGSPVPAASLEELGVAAERLANDVLSTYAEEQTQLHQARCKVRPVIGESDGPTPSQWR